MESPQQHADVIIAGGGPAGAIAALLLARAGVDVLIVEKAAFPRFQIGESFLPIGLMMLEELGLLDRLRRLPHMVKVGAEFGMGGGLETSVFRFNTSLVGGANETFNIARADFDAMLLEAALEAGARIAQPAAIRRIEKLADDDVAVVLDDGRCVTARCLLDATGHAALVGRHLGIRKIIDAPHLRKVAYFAHFENVRRLQGDVAGVPTVAMCDEGWFWIIPLNERSTSVGLVLDPAAAKRANQPADRMLQWGIPRCPLIADRMRGATGPATNLVRADFSFRCQPYAGPGYFLLGDAALFLDPVFSTGVCLSMKSAVHAAELLIDMLQHRTEPAAARRRYIQFMHGATGWFTRLIALYYDHHFREMFLHGRGPLGVHRAVLAVLAGHVFPKPALGVRWRFRLFDWLLSWHRRRALVPRKERFSLFASEGEDSHPPRGKHP